MTTRLLRILAIIILGSMTWNLIDPDLSLSRSGVYGMILGACAVVLTEPWPSR